MLRIYSFPHLIPGFKNYKIESQILFFPPFQFAVFYNEMYFLHF